MMAMNSHSSDMPQQRATMLDAIRDSVRSSAGYTGRTRLSDAVMAAMGSVPREEFVLPAYRHLAYDNTPCQSKPGRRYPNP